MSGSGPGSWRPSLETVLRLLSLSCGILLIIGVTFAAGIASERKQNVLAELVGAAWANLNAVGERLQPKEAPFIQPAHRPGDGVTINRVGDDGMLVLIAGFFDGGNQIRLIRRDGTLVRRWPLSFTSIFPDRSHLAEPPVDDWHVDLHGVLIEPDGSIVFNFEYSGLVKLDRCGGVVWALDHPTHHSIERASKGGYWVPGRVQHRGSRDVSFRPFTEVYRDGIVDEDLVLRVSEAGAIVDSFSVPALLYDNGMMPLLTATGEPLQRGEGWERELVHVNDVEELSSAMADAFPMFQAGDLMISLRKYNLVFVVDPDTKEVIWHSTGPWQRQHDPDFLPDGTISVFDNNLFWTDFPDPELNPTGPLPITRLIRFDPASGEYKVAWGERPGQEIATPIRGSHAATPDGGYLITEFAGGRIFQVDRNGDTVWEYINRFDEDYVAEMTNALLVPENDFTVTDWSCPES